MKTATIIDVKGSDIRVSDPFTGKRSDYGNYAIAKEDESGTEHVIYTGSINQVPEHLRKVGQKGVIVWDKSASYYLPFFRAE
jgi:hypothetical protein